MSERVKLIKEMFWVMKSGPVKKAGIWAYYIMGTNKAWAAKPVNTTGDASQEIPHETYYIMHAALTAHDTYYILIIYYTVHLG